MTGSQFYAEYIYNAFALSLHKSFIVFLRKFDYIHCKLNTKNRGEKWLVVETAPAAETNVKKSL